jgi:two-component sensor histidine kinase
MFTSCKKYFIGDYLKKSDSLHDQSRATLLFNITFTLILTGSITSIISLILGTYGVLIPSLGNIILAGVTLLLLKYVNLQLAASIYFFALYLLLFGSLNFNEGVMHVGSPFWIMLLNILVMYILGKKWGVAYMIASVLGFVHYIIYVLPLTIDQMMNMDTPTYYSVIHETIFALAILWYVVSTILKASYDSESLLSTQNQQLMNKNEVISQNNNEKTVLLKEIHHRVKNNLQVIISLMRLQMRELESKEAIEKFKETINRVLTMSMIHEKMYQSESLSKVNLEQYFFDLSSDLLSSYEIEYKVEFNSTFNLDQIELKSIVPLALIFNELYSNSLKHAFLSVKSPVIELTLKKESERVLILEYSDNGTWKNPEKEMSFGLELIDSLTAQLDGELTFTSSPKTTYLFRFNNISE